MACSSLAVPVFLKLAVVRRNFGVAATAGRIRARSGRSSALSPVRFDWPIVGLIAGGWNGLVRYHRCRQQIHSRIDRCPTANRLV